MVTEAAGQEFLRTTVSIINICFGYLLFVAFVSGAFFELKKASNWLVSLTKKDCHECKRASKIDCRGAVHIVRVLWGFRQGVFPTDKLYVLEIAWLLLKKDKM